MFKFKENTNLIKVKYLIMNASSSHNIIIGRPTLNLLGSALLIMYQIH